MRPDGLHLKATFIHPHLATDLRVNERSLRVSSVVAVLTKPLIGLHFHGSTQVTKSWVGRFHGRRQSVSAIRPLTPDPPPCIAGYRSGLRVPRYWSGHPVTLHLEFSKLCDPRPNDG